MLVKCYKYDFYYFLEYDLVDIYLEVFDRIKVLLLLYDWFYIVGWKFIKFVFLIFKIIVGIYMYYVDEFRIIEKKKELEFRYEYDFFDEGIRFVFEFYLEYDE